MTNRTLLHIAGALLGTLAALAATAACAAGLLWLSDQSDVVESGGSLLVTLGLVLIAVGAVFARRKVVRLLA